MFEQYSVFTAYQCLISLRRGRVPRAPQHFTTVCPPMIPGTGLPLIVPVTSSKQSQLVKVSPRRLLRGLDIKASENRWAKLAAGTRARDYVD